MNILVCTDGEAHSRKAIDQAISLSLDGDAELTALHVVDPWLKQFSHEIYAQGRAEYLDYVEECLEARAAEARAEFDGLCRERGLSAGFRTRHGEPEEEILAAIREEAPDLVITGGRNRGRWGRFRSADLPARLLQRAGQQTAMLTLRGETA